MSSIESEIKEKLSALNPNILEVLDESSQHGSLSSHFRILIVSSVFEGLSPVKRHQKVYQALGSEIMGRVHAFSQQTYTPEEWKDSGQRLSSPKCHRGQST